MYDYALGARVVAQFDVTLASRAAAMLPFAVFRPGLQTLKACLRQTSIGRRSRLSSQDLQETIEIREVGQSLSSTAAEGREDCRTGSAVTALWLQRVW